MKKVLLAVIALLGLSAPAYVSAQAVFDFANLTYDGPGTALSDFSGFLPTSGGVFCTGGDLCSSNVASTLGGSMTYSSGGLFVTATGFNGGPASVVQDHENSYNGLLFGANANGAGLGVYHSVSPPNNDDNVTATGDPLEPEILKLSFNQVVPVTTVGLRAEGHKTFGWFIGATFEYSLDGSTWTAALLPDGSGMFNLNQSNQDFYFRYGGANPDQFYVSSITAVPEPEIYAMLAAGLGLMGFVARRRKQLEAAA